MRRDANRERRGELLYTQCLTGRFANRCAAARVAGTGAADALRRDMRFVMGRAGLW